jgi:hypothetical protein
MIFNFRFPFERTHLSQPTSENRQSKIILQQ